MTEFKYEEVYLRAYNIVSDARPGAADTSFLQCPASPLEP